jgi:hypothetical protein
VGPALGRTLSVLLRHSFVILPLAALFFLVPTWLELRRAGAAWDDWQAWQEARERSWSFRSVGEGPGYWHFFNAQAPWWEGLVGFVFPLGLQTCVAFLVFQALRGGRVQYGRAIAAGFARLPSAGLAAILVGLLVVVASLGLVMAGGRFGLVGLMVMTLVAAVFAVGILTTFYVAVPAIVVERVGPLRGLGRSARLTEGWRWKVVSFPLMFFLVAVVFVYILRNHILELPESLAAVRTSIVVTSAVSALLAAASSVAAAVVYHDVRKAKEGVGVDELLRVFA